MKGFAAPTLLMHGFVLRYYIRPRNLLKVKPKSKEESKVSTSSAHC